MPQRKVNRIMPKSLLKKLGGTFIVFCFLAACSSHHLSQGRAFKLEPASYDELPGWEDDNFLEAFPALVQSCRKPSADWLSFCRGLNRLQGSSSDKIASYIESHLTPYRVISYGSDIGTFTGYYEAELTGTRQRISETQVPIYGLPVDYERDKKICSREEIEQNPDFEAPIIAWADDPVEKFILQIQGSGRMMTPDGEIKLGYAGNNGHSFIGIGTIMREAGVLERGKASMPEMRKWLRANPEKARALMARNPRYIFFKEIQGDSPYGAAGVVLTPKRSIAVDNTYIPMNTPVWLDTVDPDGVKLNRLVVAQDIGSAIRGGIRADFFWGHGEEAFDKAGRMKSRGRYYLLLPE